MKEQPRAASQALKFSALLIASMLAPLVLLQLVFSPPGIDIIWDWANGMGYMAVAISLFLFVYKGRARAFPAYSGRFFANLHRDLGYCVAALLSGHVGLLLLAEPLLLEHLKPTAPLHMSAGLFALILMLLLIISSIPVLRRRLWSNYHVFRVIHLSAAVAALGLLGYHIVVSGFYLNTLWKTGLLASVVVAILLYYGLNLESKMPETVLRLRNSARYSHLIVYSCLALALLIALLIAVLINLE